ncbi:MAG: nucleotidyltransferase [Elusimicrobia bacterium]|nr:nucleotidyltransferase [Elusimicrobiota bacterium]
MENERTREDDYKEFAALLNRHGVDYLIVGSYAVIYHTRVPRDTKDIDFWIRPTAGNALKCADAVKEFCGLELTKEDLLEDKIFFIGREPHRLDIFNSQGGLDFESAWRKREDGKFREVPVHYISREDLVRLKRRFDREHDRKDVVRLTRKKNK